MSTDRLDSLTPADIDAIAGEIVHKAILRAHQLVGAINGRIAAGLHGAGIRAHVNALVAYAQRGEHPEDGAAAIEALTSLLGWIDMDAGAPIEKSPIVLVLSAAAARQKLGARMPVPQKELAALSSVTSAAIGNAIRRGTLERDPDAPQPPSPGGVRRPFEAPIRYSDAARWVREHDVVGVE